MANDIVWWHSGEVGAPTVNNAAGARIALLDALLVTGFRPLSVTSLVVASGVATATVSSPQYEVGKMVDIAGATPSGLNGRKKLLSVTGTTVTFDATGIADTTATGTITVKRSPLGWTKAVTGTNKAIYTRSDPAATAQGLWVDDTAGGVRCLVRSIESWTGIDSHTGPSPDTSAAEWPTGLRWDSGADTTTVKPWVAVGDSRMLYLFMAHSLYNGYTSSNLTVFAMFGDPIPVRASDPYSTVVGAVSPADATPWRYVDTGAATIPATTYLQRSANQLAGSVRAALGAVTGARGPGNTDCPAYPSIVDGGLMISTPMWLHESAPDLKHPIRALLPGLCSPMAQPSSSLHLREIPGADGHTYLYVHGAFSAGPLVGGIAIDISHAWR